MWMWLAGAGAAGFAAYEYFKKRPAHAAPSGSGLAPQPSIPGQTGQPGKPPGVAPNAPAPAPVVIAPPNVPQPPGIITIPVLTTPVTPDVHDMAANLVQAVKTMSPTQSSFKECSDFQNSYNGTNPLVPLATDGKYGPKTRAALQAIIAPAVAPADFFPSPAVTVAPIPNPAPPPVLNTEIQDAAGALMALGSSGSIPKGVYQQVVTFQHTYNGHNPVTHLVEDGKYGGNTQNALQSVLVWLAQGATAPKNSYGPPKSAVPVFPG